MKQFKSEKHFGYYLKSVDEWDADFINNIYQTEVKLSLMYEWVAVYSKIALNINSDGLNDYLIKREQWHKKQPYPIKTNPKPLAYFYYIMQREGKLPEFKWKQKTSSVIAIAKHFGISVNGSGESALKKYMQEASKKAYTEANVNHPSNPTGYAKELMILIKKLPKFY